MSETRTMPSGAATARISAYVTQVRAELSDLSAEEVDDLTFGMEADLGELVAESGQDLRVRLGTPQSYAAELRAAAGLPPRPTRSRDLGGLGPAVREWSRRRGSAILTSVPWLAELRSVWWLIRGLVLGGLLGYWLSSGPPWPLLGMAAGVVASVWLGLRTRSHRAAWWPVAAVNLAAVLLLLPWASLALTRPSGAYDTEIQYQLPQDGVFNNGVTVGNLYAYDGAGRRLEGVRLFDQTGKQVVIGGESAEQMTGFSFDPLADDSRFYLPNGEPRRSETFPTDWFGRAPWERITGWTPPMSIVPLSSPTAPTSDASATTATSTTGTSTTGTPGASTTSPPTSASSSSSPPASSTASSSTSTTTTRRSGTASSTR